MPDSPSPASLVPQSLDAQWLVDQLRSSRLTVLCGDTGAALTGLLREGVLPRLQRRAAELDQAEVCIHFDRWHQIPRQALTRALREAVIARGADPQAGRDLPLRLSDKLRALARGSAGLRFLIVLDGFEACLRAPPERGDLKALCEEIFSAMNEADVPAQFLLVLREHDGTLLESLRGRLIGFDVVRQPLPTGQAAGLGLPAGLSPSPVGAAAEGPSIPQTAAVYTSIERGPERAANRGPQAQQPAVPPPPSPSLAPEMGFIVFDEPVGPSAGAPSKALLPELAGPDDENLTLAEGASHPQPAAHGVRGRFGRLPWLVGLVVLLAGLGWALRPAEDLGLLAQAPALETGSARLPRPSPTGAAPLELVGGDLLAGRIGEDVSRVLTASGVVLQPSLGWREDLDRLQGGTRFAVAREDALRAAKAEGSTGPLHIVTPLVAQELAFVVRADSPLRHIHEVQGRRINIGPAEGARALTVRTAYRSLFGQDLPLARASLAGETSALDELLHRSTDVVVLVGNAPAPWDHAWPEMVGGLRLLTLRADHPSSQRALRAMQPGSLAAGPDAAATPTLSVMSYLVTGATRPLHAGMTGATDTPGELARMVELLCRHLPVLQRDGHPKWRELRAAGEQEEARWPYAAEAQRLLQGCTGAEPLPQAPT